uniref:Gamma-secretase subunit PEN-2 n=1 Tax=Glossina brevipalpis TaxID=37001 RepID=A0A1A9WJE2_9MUSC
MNNGTILDVGVCIAADSNGYITQIRSLDHPIKNIWLNVALTSFTFIYLNIEMNLSKVSNEKKLQLCKIYFRTGFVFLPFVWAVNFCWFFKEAFKTPIASYPEQKQIKNYVIYSALGTIVWLLLLTVWIIIFQAKRAEWGALADYMSFIIPLGKA